MMEAWPHQVAIAKEAIPIITKYGMVYLAMEERTGKTIVAIRIYEHSKVIKKVLVVTTVKAMAGWNKTLKEYKHAKDYTVINYHSVLKSSIKGGYDAVILDESHKYISGYPKRSKIWNDCFKMIFGLPIIFSSATPHAQGPQLLFNQFALNRWTLWGKFKNYYEWFSFYAERDSMGNVKTKRIGPAHSVVDYTAVQVENIMKEVSHLFITYTRKQLGFEQEPEDKLHYVKLSDGVKNIYNTLVKKRVIDFTLASTGKEYSLICDSPARLRWALHQLEGGTAKINGEYLVLGNREKVDYILDNWGDTKELVIMYHYKPEKTKLERIFKNAKLLQATSYAEGIDLSMFKHLVMYSQNFSTAQHTQRRARQANMKRKEKIIVHYILTKGGMSDKAYKTVAINKKNFVDTVFEGI